MPIETTPEQQASKDIQKAAKDDINKLNQVDDQNLNVVGATLNNTVTQLPPKEEIISVTNIKEKEKVLTPYEQLEKSIISGKTQIPYKFEDFKNNIGGQLGK
jgi:hypothetical protein